MILPEICGYGVKGNGATPIEAILECEKAYQKLTKGYREHWRGNEEYAKFTSAVEYFGGHLEIIKIPSCSIDGDGDYIGSGEVLKIYKERNQIKTGKLTDALL